MPASPFAILRILLPFAFPLTCKLGAAPAALGFATKVTAFGRNAKLGPVAALVLRGALGPGAAPSGAVSAAKFGTKNVVRKVFPLAGRAKLHVY